MKAKTIAVMVALLVVGGILLTACQPQEVVTTIVVTEIVEREGEQVVVTQIVEVTPEPAPPTPEEAEPPLAVISPEFKNPDTYVVIAGAGEPETLDPAWTYETAGSAVENNIYESLVWFEKDRTDAFVPMLATSWEVNDAGDVWTFQVREGVTFHEGGTLEPHDVAYSMHRALLQDRIDGPHWMTLEAFFGEFAIEDIAMGISGVDSFDAVSEADLVATCELVKGAIVAGRRCSRNGCLHAQPTDTLVPGHDG